MECVVLAGGGVVKGCGCGSLVRGRVLAMRVVVGPKCMGVQLRGSGCKRPLGKWASLWPVAPVAGGCCW